MYKSSLLTLNLILICICAGFAVTLELFEAKAMASLFACAMCIFIAIAAVPLSLERINKRNKVIHNLLIVLSTNFTVMLMLFLTTTFAYLGLFNATMFTFFEVVFYPATLAILLVEYIVAQMKKRQYINSMKVTIDKEDEDA